jgi:hypothetical protein
LVAAEITSNDPDAPEEHRADDEIYRHARVTARVVVTPSGGRRVSRGSSHFRGYGDLVVDAARMGNAVGEESSRVAGHRSPPPDRTW